MHVIKVLYNYNNFQNLYPGFHFAFKWYRIHYKKNIFKPLI